jgi:alpha-tubulin suppressor-like RCC1 family protein
LADGIAVGSGFACARVGASAYCWGGNGASNLGHAPGTEGDLVSDAGGTVFINPQPELAAATGVVALFSGNGPTCMIDGSGTVSCWGYGFWGELGDPAGKSNSFSPVPIPGVPMMATYVAISMFNVCAAMAGDGGVYCWGNDDSGGDGYADASFFTEGNAAAPVPALAGTPIIALAASTLDATICALTPNASVFCWGSNLSDQLGHEDAAGEGQCLGETACDPLPIQVGGLP